MNGLACVQAEEAREKAAAAAAEAARLAAQTQVLGREAKIGRELRDENYRLEESLQTCVTSGSPPFTEVANIVNITSLPVTY